MYKQNEKTKENTVTKILTITDLNRIVEEKEIDPEEKNKTRAIHIKRYKEYYFHILYPNNKEEDTVYDRVIGAVYIPKAKIPDGEGVLNVLLAILTLFSRDEYRNYTYFSSDSILPWTSIFVSKNSLSFFSILYWYKNFITAVYFTYNSCSSLVISLIKGCIFSNNFVLPFSSIFNFILLYNTTPITELAIIPAIEKDSEEN
jgi:hypothetical protein